MIWFLANIRLIGFALIVAMIPTAYLIGGYKGRVKCEARQELEQMKHEAKVRRNYEEIDRKTPYSADRAHKLEWLRNHAGE